MMKSLPVSVDENTIALLKHLVNSNYDRNTMMQYDGNIMMNSNGNIMMNLFPPGPKCDVATIIGRLKRWVNCRSADVLVIEIFNLKLT